MFLQTFEKTLELEQQIIVKKVSFSSAVKKYADFTEHIRNKIRFYKDGSSYLTGSVMTVQTL